MSSGVTVIMTTYCPPGKGAIRAEYAVQTLHALIDNLKSPLPIRLHVADDGSTNRDFIKVLLREAKVGWHTEGDWTNAERGGIGASLNRAIEQQAPDELLMYMTDDWMLTEPLDLAPAIMLINDFKYDLVRLSPIHPDLQCQTKHHLPIGWWLHLHMHSPGYVFATRPFLATTGFFDHVGPFQEGLDAYDTERAYNDLVKARGSHSRLLIAQADTGLAGPWKHLGEYEVGHIQPGAE